MKQHTFNKTERLKSRKLIEQLFRSGKSFLSFPFKVIYAFVEDENVPLKAGVAVSSRNFKKAVERNRVKRVIREAYRLQKLQLADVLQQQNKQLAIFFVYVGKEMPAFEELKKKMALIIDRFNGMISPDKS